LPDTETKTAGACPLCGLRQTFLVRSLGVAAVVALWRQQYQMDVRSYFRELSSFDLRQCANCSLQYFTPEWLAGPPELYAQLGRGPEYYRAQKWEHDVALEDVRGAHRLLEVGCGFGDFVARARAECRIDAEGLEQNEEALQEAARRNIPVRRGDLCALAATAPGSYDAVCMFQVLEHIARPGEFLAAVCKLLRPGGKLVLGVPNAASFMRYAFNPLDMPPHHMTRWTRGVLAHLCEVLPVRVEQVRIEPLADYHTAHYVEAHFSHWSTRFPLRALGHPQVKGVATKLINASGVRGLLGGHTLYACLVRT
jgi:SAM-dependent methyltransferase